MPAELKSASHGHTMVLTLSNPEHRNALGPEIYAAGIEALSVAETVPEVRSVVITGQGANFCAGGQLQRLLAARRESPEIQAQAVEGLHGLIEAIRTFPKPVIAAVEGAAAGAGFSLALACDFIVAASDAIFVMAYANVALSPDGGASWSLTQFLPRQLAAQLLMSGERIGAPRLHELGVVNRLAPTGGAMDEALELATRLDAKAPNVMASIKELMNEATGASFTEHLARERNHFVKNLNHANAGIGIESFLAKKPARYE